MNRPEEILAMMMGNTRLKKQSVAACPKKQTPPAPAQGKHHKKIASRFPFGREAIRKHMKYRRPFMAEEPPEKRRTTNTCLFVFLLLTTLSACASRVPMASHHVVAYLPYYEVNAISKRTRFIKGVTQINYFGIHTNSDGSLDFNRSDGTAIDHDFYINQVKKMRRNRKTKILLVINEWVSSGSKDGKFPQMAADPQARARFVQNVYDYCMKHELDGVDIDWEFPRTDEEWENAQHLFQELAAKLKPKGLLLTAAVFAGSYQGIQKYVVDHVDYLNLMIYDRPEVESVSVPYFGQVIKDYVDAGCPVNKLVPGVPFYGRKLSHWSTAKSYRNLYKMGGTMKNPANHRAHGFEYNGPNVITEKSQAAIDLNTAGIMIWAIGQDLAYQKKGSLLRAINQVIPVRYKKPASSRKRVAKKSKN